MSKFVSLPVLAIPEFEEETPDIDYEALGMNRPEETIAFEMEELIFSEQIIQTRLIENCEPVENDKGEKLINVYLITGSVFVTNIEYESLIKLLNS